MKERLICFVLGLVFGTFPTGYLYASLKGVNIRKMGSGNVGSTNMLRSMGPKAGAVTLVGDMLKTFIPLWITSAVFRNQTDIRYVLAIWTGVGAMLGHCYSPFLGFNGGKGVACFGANAIYSGPVNFFVLLAVFLASCIFTGYVSVGSLLVGLGFLVLNVITVLTGRPAGWGKHLTFAPGYGIEIILLSAVMLAIIVHRHKANIERLLSGTENKFTFGKKEGKDRAPERPF